jgi:hypothetical protein
MRLLFNHILKQPSEIADCEIQDHVMNYNIKYSFVLSKLNGSSAALAED